MNTKTKKQIGLSLHFVEKGWIIILFVLLTILLSSCHPNRQIHNVLESDLRGGEMYRQILRNRVYTAQLVDSINNLKKTNEVTRYASVSTLNILEDSVKCRMVYPEIVLNKKPKP